MENEQAILESAGLSRNEAILYLLLAKGGKQKASELSKKSGIHRISIYDTLRQLEAKGLAGKVEQNGVTYFSPSPPAALQALVDEKKEAIEKIIPSLGAIFKATPGVHVSVLYGKAGVKTVLEDILDLKSDFFVYHGQLAIADILPSFFPIFNEKRKQAGIKAKWMLLDSPQAREKAKLVPLTKFKFIKSLQPSAGVWWTYSDRVILFVTEPEIVTIFIKNHDLANTFQKNFEDIFRSQNEAV